ncbi:MAG: carboxylesterase family protein [Myxococcota bacterium]
MLRIKGPTIAVGLIASLSVTVACSRDEGDDPAAAEARAVTDFGVIEGIAEEEVHSFLGIRYAQPPVGENRFLSPQPLSDDEQTRDATSFGNRCFQTGVLDILVTEQAAFDAESEDCLFLNVYTPSRRSEDMPVLVWIHGGAFTSGSGNDYDPKAIVAEEDVVVVTINYRLNIFGFIDLARFGEGYEGSANLGTQDQISALQWISKHVHAFGGDPSNVTVWGQSAGATSTSSLLSAPAAQGLLDKVMALSGGEVLSPPRDQFGTLAEFLSIESDDEALRALRAMSAQELLDLQANTLYYVGPSLDGQVLMQRQSDAVASGWASEVPVLLGTTLDDGTLLAPAFAVNEQVGELTLLGLAADIGEGDGARYLSYLEDTLPGAGVEERMTRAWFDFFRSSALRIAASASQNGAGGWVYNFEVPTDDPLGVTHYSEVPFAFRWIEPEHPGLFVHPATAENQEISEVWSSTLVEFARSGSPNGAGLPEWRRFQPSDFASMRVSRQSALVENRDADLLEIYGVQ